MRPLWFEFTVMPHSILEKQTVRREIMSYKDHPQSLAQTMGRTQSLYHVRITKPSAAIRRGRAWSYDLLLPLRFESLS